MRQQFEQHRRRRRNARFVVGAIPQSAPAPFGFVGGADVADDLTHHQIGQVTRQVAAGTPFEAAAVLLCEVDAQRADRLVVAAHAGVGVEGQRHVDGNVQTLFVGQPFGAAHERVDPVGARHVILLVVVEPLLLAVDRFGKSRPLQPIAGALAETGITARLAEIVGILRAELRSRRAGDVAHAAADLHGVGRHDAVLFRRAVAQRDQRRILSRREAECPQIDPCAAAHGLIDRETALATQMAHRVEGILRTAFDRLVGDVDCVFAARGQVGAPFGTALAAVGYGLHAACRPLRKGVLALDVDLAPVCESRSRVEPAAVAGEFDVGRSFVHARIVVGDRLLGLHVAFARQQHVGTRPFEHRHQVRQHVTLRVEVFTGLPQPRTLPAPAVLLLIEIAAVALPHRYVAPRESVRRFHGRRQAGHQRTVRTVGEGLAPATAAVDLRNQLLDRVLVRHERQAPTGERGGQQAADRVVDRRHAPLAEGIVGHADRGVERQAVACVDDLCDVRLAARHLAVEDAGEHLRNLLPLFGREAFGRSRNDRQQQRQEEDKESVFHHFLRTSSNMPSMVNRAL